MSTAPLLVEIGTEELPPKALRTLGEAFRDGITHGLTQNDLAFGDVVWFATPRRLAVLIQDVQLQADGKEVEVLGPPADRAKGEDGSWTPAASGFAKKQGVTPEQLQTIDTPKGPRLGLRRRDDGAVASDCLNNIVQESIEALPIPKRMRWGANREEFVRPAHWVVLMLGERHDFGEILGLTTGRSTKGHRFHSNGAIELGSPEEYRERLLAEKVIASFEERRDVIRQQVEAQAAALGASAVIDPDLLDEVTGLVEWPVTLAGSFEQRFLDVPQEALISSMKEHQKYFHVVDGQGGLMPYFITISNIESSNPALVISGNERVIRPRLSDAAFFYETDCKTPLADRLPALKSVVFQQKLGTLHDKSRRVATLAAELATRIGAPRDLAERAAILSKADLVTDMVLEFSDMQGIAGSYYAARDGEAADVASALAEQYWPRFAGDKLPQTPTACALGLADRIDTLVGIFGIGQAPTGSKDPFALRRASLAVLRILVEKGLDLDLRECLELAAEGFPEGVLTEETTEKVLAYMIERFRAWYEDEQIPVEVFKAVSAKDLSQPLDIHRRIQAVHAFSQLPQAQALAAANKRVSNILAKLDNHHQFGEVSTDLLCEEQESALSSQLQTLKAKAGSHLEREQYTEALAVLASLREPVDAFFDSVMVNVDDEPLRNNRLNLLKSLRDLFLEVADISQLVVSK